MLVTFIWGSTFVIVKGALGDASPLPFLALRFTLAGILLVAALGRRSLQPRALIPATVLGVFLFGGYLFQTWGLTVTTPSKAAFITGSSVIMVPLLLMLAGTKLRGANILGAFLGLVGIYLLVMPSGLDAVNRGDALVLACAVCFAVHIVLVGRYTQRYSFLDLVPVQISTVGLAAAAALPFDRGRFLHWTPRLTVALAITAVLATGFAFGVQNWAQQFTPPAHTALIFALEPVFAALTSRLMIGERLGGRVLAGCALILAGMVISELWGVARPSPVEG